MNEILTAGGASDGAAEGGGTTGATAPVTGRPAEGVAAAFGSPGARPAFAPVPADGDRGPAHWQTHAVTNLVDELDDYDLFATDPPLKAALDRAGAGDFVGPLAARGRWLGQPRVYELAARANETGPRLETFDARGRRIDRVDFPEAWNTLLAALRDSGVISLPFADRRPGRWSAWAATFYLHGQVEAGTLCPATMTQASIPVLSREPGLWSVLGPKLLDDGFDPADLPIADKTSIWVGMGMTEKQGGSDVRANATRATADGVGGRGEGYRLRGHKWFFSVPQSDAHLVVARTADDGLSCFFVPRRMPDGELNGVRIQRLKHKVGNRSNASSEVEFQDAWGVLIGEEGRGIPTIIEMATYTRLNCVVGSTAIMRQALVQAIHHARGRRAFGRQLADQPLMRTVLADLALESEAALTLSMRLAAAYEGDAGDGADGAGRGGEALSQQRLADRAWKRIVTPAAKAWICKRAIEFTGEAMEVIGGNGYIDTGIVARLFREAPVNSIWEGSGNVMCLDVLRAIGREPDAWQTLLADLAGDPDRRVIEWRNDLVELAAEGRDDPDATQARGRALVERLVLLAQARLLREVAPAFVADAFVASRLAPTRALLFGAAPIDPATASALIDRAFPR